MAWAAEFSPAFPYTMHVNSLQANPRTHRSLHDRNPQQVPCAKDRPCHVFEATGLTAVPHCLHAQRPQGPPQAGTRSGSGTCPRGRATRTCGWPASASAASFEPTSSQIRRAQDRTVLERAWLSGLGGATAAGAITLSQAGRAWFQALVCGVRQGPVAKQGLEQVCCQAPVAGCTSGMSWAALLTCPWSCCKLQRAQHNFKVPSLGRLGTSVTRDKLQLSMQQQTPKDMMYPCTAAHAASLQKDQLESFLRPSQPWQPKGLHAQPLGSAQKAATCFQGRVAACAAEASPTSSLPPWWIHHFNNSASDRAYLRLWSSHGARQHGLGGT